MKNIFKYLNLAILFAVLSTAFVACDDNDEDDLGNVGLNIKVFSPTMVVPGQAMTINGSGFGDVVEVEFPGNIKVTDFEIVTNEMIRVAAPKGLSESGPIIVRNSAGKTAESRLKLTVGEPEITRYSAQPGDTLKGKDVIIVYGHDLLCIESAEFVDKDSASLLVKAEEFIRLTANRAEIQIPTNVIDGIATIKILIGGKIVESPEFKFEPVTEGGHWETTKRYLWKNETGAGPANWGDFGYRFCEDGHDFNNECIGTFSTEDWELIKTQSFYVDIEKTADWANIRVTSGWWSTNYLGMENVQELLQEEEDGTLYLDVNLTEDPALLAVIDEQHLLFTGSDYKVLGIYVLEQKWVGGGGHMESVKTTFWKNETGAGPANWGDFGYRFCEDGHDFNNECIGTFSTEVWNIIKTEPFRVAIEKTADWSNIRVTSGWWSTNYLGKENVQELLQEEEDGTLYLEVNLADDPALLAVIDEQHLLFTGSDYKVTEIYQVKEEWIDGGDEGPQEVVIWENESNAGPANWGDFGYRFCEDGHDFNNECIATFSSETWEFIKTQPFRVVIEKTADWSNIRVTSGWWSTNYLSMENVQELLQEEEDGTLYLEVNLADDSALLAVIDEQHLLFTGSDYILKKIYYIK